VWGINQRYFSLKISVEIFNAQMQEVDFKKMYNFQFILCTFLFWAPSLHRKFQLQDFWIHALVWWCQKHHLTSHTHILSQHFTKKFFFHTTLYSHATPSRTENDLCLLSFVPVCVIVSSMFFTMGNREFLRGISLLHQGKSN
jgi:hypothetical protein